MIARGSGVIVNFPSGWGRSTSPEVARYCCTKWGVEGLTQELPSGLAAVTLNPGILFLLTALPAAMRASGCAREMLASAHSAF